MMHASPREGSDRIARPIPSRGAPALGTARRVAIVEDEAMVAWALESLIEDLGHRVVDICSNGEDAIRDLPGAGIDIVFMDINLGRGMDGVETARILRATGRIAVVFISAYSDAGTRAKIRDTIPGAPLLPKPVDAIALRAALESVAH